jgi:prophage antirepressor-like protein
MNQLQIFKNSEFGEVRTVIIENEPWFVAKDVADALQYSETNAMTRRLDDEDVISTKLTDMNMRSTLINESGLYAAVIGSQLPSAKKFKRWITSEVLPQIRKTGSYMDLTSLPPELQLMNALVQQVNIQALNQQKLQIAIDDAKQEIQDMRDAIVINPKAEWRREVDSILRKIGFKVDDYSAVRRESYEALKERARCKPTVLVNNLKKRAKENGMQKSKVDNINLMDVLENDVRLREIYISIVKEMRIKWGV